MGGGMPDPGIRLQIFEPGRLNGSKYYLFDNIRWSHDITCSVDSTEKTIRNSEEFENFRSDHFELRNFIMIICFIFILREGVKKKKNKKGRIFYLLRF